METSNVGSPSCNNLIKKFKNKINFFGDQSNLHGVGYVFSLSYLSIFKRFFWLAILISCCLGALLILREVLSLYSGDVVSYSVETNYLTWETPFPAVTICDQLDADRVKTFLIANQMPVTLSAFLKEALFWNLKYCRSCPTCKLNISCIEDFHDYAPKIRRNCSELLTDCWWGGQAFPCCERFLPLESEYGVCYTFNSKLTGNDTNLLTVNRRVGLPGLTLSAIQPISIRASASDELVSVSMENVLGRSYSVIPLVSDMEAILKAEQTTSEISVQSLPRAQRGCLMWYERPAFAHLWPFQVYSYNTCVLYCRTWKQSELCNCTHHFMPKLNKIPVCGIQGMGCLNKNKDNLITVDCECPMGCEEILYKAIYVFYKRDTKPSPELLKRGSRITIRIAQLPSLRVLRHAIRTTLGLVVDIGGVGGVFFGASLLSVIEVLYLFCIRRS